MATRKALVLVGGVIQELSASDALAGAGGNVPYYVDPSSTLLVSSGQALYQTPIDVDGIVQVDGMLIEVP